MNPVVGKIEREVAARVGRGVRRLLHALGQPKEYDLVASRRLIGRLIGYRSGERGSQGRS
jgi:hypothetical protein